MVKRRYYLPKNPGNLTIIILFSVLIISACFPSLSPSPEIASTSTASLQSPQTKTLTSTPRLITTPSFTPAPTFTSTIKPTPTFCPGKNLFCINGFEVREILGKYMGGTWSPVESRIMFATDRGFALASFSAPDFQEHKIPFSQEGFYVSSEKVWKPDGKKLFFFAWNQNELDSGKMEYISPWFASTLGEKVRPLNMKFIARDPEILGWVGPDTLAIASYCARRMCLDLLNAQTGSTVASALFRGTPGHPNNNYVPAMYSNYSAKLLVIGKVKTGPKSSNQGEQEDLEYCKWFPYDGLKALDSTFFADWLPGTNQMLVSWMGADLQEDRLYIWDVDKNSTKLIVPDGLTGNFSPDGKILAYLSNGLAQLDKNQKPVPNTTRGRKDFQPYLQLYDMSSEQVFGSFPIIANFDFTWDYPVYEMKFNFSTDGHYLAFLSNHAIQTDDKGWPSMQAGNQAEINQSYLTVLDLQQRKSVLSRKGISVLPVWSPTRNQMVFLNGRDEVILFDVLNSEETTLTRPINSNASLKWSYDGSYLSIESPTNQDLTWLGFAKIQ